MREHWSALRCMMLAFMNHESCDDPIRGSKVQSLGDGNVCSSTLELEEAFYSPTTQPLHPHRMRSRGLNKYNSQDSRRAESPEVLPCLLVCARNLAVASAQHQKSESTDNLSLLVLGLMEMFRRH